MKQHARVVVIGGGAVCVALCVGVAVVRVLRRSRQDAQPLVKVHDGRDMGRHGPSVTTSI